MTVIVYDEKNSRSTGRTSTAQMPGPLNEIIPTVRHHLLRGLANNVNVAIVIIMCLSCWDVS